jgi:hypothetical protein
MEILLSKVRLVNDPIFGATVPNYISCYWTGTGRIGFDGPSRSEGG